MKTEEIKKINDSRSLKEIEQEMEILLGSAHDMKYMFVSHLQDIQRYERFRQDPRYKESSFETYLRDRWNMGGGQYRNEKKVLIRHPKECKEFGIGTVARVFNKCDHPEAVLEEIKKTQNTKKRPMTQAAYETIIEKHKKPIPIKEKPVEISKPDQDLIDRGKNQEEKIAQQAEQIEKLKNTVRELKPYKEKYLKLVDLLRSIFPDLAKEEEKARA